MSEAPKKPTIWERIVDAFMNKVFEAVVLVIVGSAMFFFGYPHVLDKLGFSNPVTDLVEVEEVTTGEEEQSMVRKTAPAVSYGTTVAGNNVGFQRKPKYLGISSEFSVLEPGEHEAPFTELKSGVHDFNWSAHLRSKEGGLWGIGSKATEWQAKGVMTAEFEQNSFYSLLEDGEEDFLNVCLQPLIAEAAQNVMRETDIAALAKELFPENANQEIPAEDAEVTEASFVDVETEQPLSELEKFSERLTEETNRLMDDKYSVRVESMQVEEMRILKKADLKDPHLDSLAGDSIYRNVVKQATQLDTFRNGKGGGILSAVLFVVFIAFMGLLVFNFHN